MNTINIKLECQIKLLRKSLQVCMTAQCINLGINLETFQNWFQMAELSKLREIL